MKTLTQYIGLKKINTWYFSLIHKPAALKNYTVLKLEDEIDIIFNAFS